MKIRNNLPQEQFDELCKLLRDRFEKNRHRHEGLDWNVVEARLRQNENKIWSLHQMEETGGEPDVIGYESTGRCSIRR